MSVPLSRTLSASPRAASAARPGAPRAALRRAARLRRGARGAGGARRHRAGQQPRQARAGGGDLFVAAGRARRRAGVEIVAVDRGPGHARTTRGRCDDGYSTAGSAGHGLGAIARLSDASTSTPRRQGHGDRLADLARRPPGAPAVAVGARLRDDAGETVPRRRLRGRDMAEPDEDLCWRTASATGPAPGGRRVRPSPSSTAATAHVDRRAARAIHRALRPTRGAAVAIAEIDPDRGSAAATPGIGNIAGTILAGGTTVRNLVSHNGTVGPRDAPDPGVQLRAPARRRWSSCIPTGSRPAGTSTPIAGLTRRDPAVDRRGPLSATSSAGATTRRAWSHGSDDRSRALTTRRRSRASSDVVLARQRARQVAALLGLRSVRTGADRDGRLRARTQRARVRGRRAGRATRSTTANGPSSSSASATTGPGIAESRRASSPAATRRRPAWAWGSSARAG